MIQTTTFDQPKSSITSHAGSAWQLSSTCQHLLPKRIARRPKPSLRGAVIALLGNVADTAICMQARRYCAPAVVERGRCLEAAMLNRTLISIIDDDEPYRESMRKLVMLLGYTVEAFPSAADFLASRVLSETACLLTDVNMQGMTGVELHRHLVDTGYAIPTILVTAYPDEVVRDRALKDGVVCYLSKPVDDNHLERCLRSALHPR
jgi:CheY-like chemotaxis protein